MDDNTRKKIVDSLADAKTANDIIATGVTAEQLAELSASKQIGDMEQARLRQLLSVDERGFRYPDMYPKELRAGLVSNEARAAKEAEEAARRSLLSD